MSETNFTKGEWHVNECETPGVLEIDCGEMMSITVITTAYDLSYSDMVERTANAHLIATAPELYKMLSIARDKLSLHMVDVNGDGNDFQDFRVLIDNLLAKARGEQQ